MLRQKENGSFRNEGVCLLPLIGSFIVSFIVAKGMKTRWTMGGRPRVRLPIIRMAVMTHCRPPPGERRTLNFTLH